MPTLKTGADGILKNGISLFFPAYNEEDNVGGTIEKSLAVLEPLHCEYEIIIVDDGSKDRTAEIVAKYSARNPRVVLVRHQKNLGYGGALQTGFRSCRYGLIFFSDCDLQFDLGELASFLAKMEQDHTVDAVIGYRIHRADPLIRRLNAYGWKIWGRALFGLKVKDVDCAFKLFKREVIQNIEIESSGALISTELLAKIKKTGFKIVESGVHHYPRKAGSQTGAKLSVIVKAFYESFKLYGKIKRYKK
ncbi:MAG: glycosyltransferase family 2 protein [Bacillota bacterium]